MKFIEKLALTREELVKLQRNHDLIMGRVDSTDLDYAMLDREIRVGLHRVYRLNDCLQILEFLEERIQSDM